MLRWRDTDVDPRSDDGRHHDNHDECNHDGYHRTTTTTAPTIDQYFSALDTTLAAGTYRFEGTLEAVTSAGSQSIELSGWVNGANYELVVNSAGQQVTTTVQDGVATVTTPAGTTDIPVADATAAPSLSILRDLQDPTMASTGQVTGTLPDAALQQTGLAEAATAGTATNATITFDPDGTLTGYTLTDDAHTWTLTLRIFDVGQVQG